MVRPSTFAIFRLMTIWYFEACSTGSSAGLAPHHGCSLSLLSAASSSARISASRSRRASAFRCRLRAARHLPLHTSWPAWIGTFRQMEHSREASTPALAGARTPSGLATGLGLRCGAEVRLRAGAGRESRGPYVVAFGAL